MRRLPRGPSTFPVSWVGISPPLADPGHAGPSSLCSVGLIPNIFICTRCPSVCSCPLDLIVCASLCAGSRANGPWNRYREGNFRKGEFHRENFAIKKSGEISPGEIFAACDQQLHCLKLWAPPANPYKNLLSVQQPLGDANSSCVFWYRASATLWCDRPFSSFICSAIFMPVIHPEPPRK